MADRLQMLQNIEQQLPMANAQQEKQLKAANALRFQQGVASAPAQADAGQLGAAAATQDAKTELAQQANLGQAQLQVGQQVGQAQAQQQQEQLFNAQQASESKLNQQVNHLSQMNSQVKAELFDKEMQIKQDSLGRQVLSTRQAADWAILNAKNQEELKSFAQTAQIAMDRKAQVIKQAHAILQQQMQEQAGVAAQESNQAFALEMNQASRGLQQWMQDLEKQGTEFSQQMAMGGTIVGGVIGGVVGGFWSGGTGAAFGAAAGAGMGSQLGQAYAGSQGAANSSGVSGTNTNVDSGGGYNRQY